MTILRQPPANASRLIARTAEEEEPLDGLFHEDLDLDILLDAVDDPTLNAHLLLRSNAHDRVSEGL